MNHISYEELRILENPSFSLRLRPIQETDTENIIRWRNSDTIRSFFIFRESLTYELHQQWLREIVYTGKAIQYIIEDHGIPIGTIYVKDIDTKNESGEFGIYIGELSHISKGIGTNATELLITYCFELGFHRIYLRVLSDNERAKKCYLKAGFVEEGTAKDMIFADGKRFDVVFMSIIKKHS